MKSAANPPGRSIPLTDPEDPRTPAERRAHTALGLPEQSPFVVIVRARILHGEPSALHRVYLDPARFKGNEFLENHDLESESLIDIYEKCGFELA